MQFCTLRLSGASVENDTYEEAEGIVVYLDALGIKGMWSKRDPMEVLKTWGIIM